MLGLVTTINLVGNYFTDKQFLLSVRRYLVLLKDKKSRKSVTFSSLETPKNKM